MSDLPGTWLSGESPVLLAFFAISVVLAVVVLRLWTVRRRERRQVAAFRAEIAHVAENSAFGMRLSDSSGSELDTIAESVNQLFDALGEKEQQMRQRETLFQELADTMPDVVLVHRERIVFANKAAAGRIGVTASQLAGRDVTDLVRPAYRAMTRKHISRRLAGEEIPDSYEMQLIDSDERSLWVEATSSLIEFRGQVAVLTVARDISYRKSVEANLGRSKQQAQITLESIGEGVITTDTDGLIDYMNAAAEKISGTSRELATGHRLGEIVKLVDESDRRDLGDPVSRCLVERKRINMGRRAILMSHDGEAELSIELTASPIIGAGDSVAGAVVIIHDVTELRGLTRQMSYQASHDPLTGLINRREFERRLDQLLVSARANGSHIMCYLDLDRFKAVNDTCGHVAGDSMLREIAALIRDKVRESDSVARLGGDEFGLLLIGCPLEKARQIADEVCQAVREYRLVWQDKVFNVGASIGLVEIGPESGAIEDVMNAADSACYIAKQQGRGRVHVYSARDEAQARQRGEIHWLRRIQSALKENRFQLFLQPVVAVAAPEAHGPAAEVFLRMVDDDGGLVLPRQFIRAAERYQLMTRLDRWVVQAALSAMSQGAIRLPEHRSLGINISGQTLADESFLEYVVDCLDHSQILPSQICFEVTEKAVLQDLDHARRFASVLQGMGCQLALDDFGEGIGSFPRLHDLAVNYLKVDGLYTHELENESLNREVVAAITRLAQRAGFGVIAEQVEQQSDFDALRELGVDFIQGNFVDPPRRIGERSAAA